MDGLQSGRQYRFDEIPSNLVNITNGDIVTYNGKTYKGIVNNNGTRSFDPYVDTRAYDGLIGDVKNATSNYAAGLNANENAIYDDYLNKIQSMPTSVDFYTKQLEEAGVPQMRKAQTTLQGQIYDLEDTLRRVEPNVTATTGNSLVTEAQRQGMVTEKQKPLIENLGWLGQSLGRVSSAITDATGQALTLTNLNSQDQARLVDAYKEKLTLAISQGDRALSAFTNDINNVLNVTLAKIARQEKVSDTEAANAFELLKLQKQAEYTMAQQKQQQSADAAKNTEVVEVGGRKKLINKTTGQVISDLGSSSAPRTGGGTTTAVTPTSAKPTSSPTSSGVNPTLYNYLFGGTQTSGTSAQLKR